VATADANRLAAAVLGRSQTWMDSRVRAATWPSGGTWRVNGAALLARVRVCGVVTALAGPGVAATVRLVKAVAAAMAPASVRKLGMGQGHHRPV
jgi:hypothetical protein